MQKFTKLESLRVAVEVAEATLSDAYRALEAESTKAEYFVYANHEDAEDALYEILDSRAFHDCEGAGNVGQPEYRQEYIVDGNKFVGILEVEYNRHDKTYYYIDDRKYRYEPVQSN
jgi:hypothetical protein